MFKVPCDNTYDGRPCIEGELCITVPDFPNPGYFVKCEKCGGSSEILVGQDYIDEKIAELENDQQDLIFAFEEDMQDIKDLISYWKDLPPHE